MTITNRRVIIIAGKVLNEVETGSLIDDLIRGIGKNDGLNDYLSKVSPENIQVCKSLSALDDSCDEKKPGVVFLSAPKLSEVQEEFNQIDQIVQSLKDGLFEVDILYCGGICSWSGSWILSDGILTASMMKAFITGSGAKLTTPCPVVRFHVGVGAVANGAEWNKMAASVHSGFDEKANVSLVVNGGAKPNGRKGSISVEELSCRPFLTSLFSQHVSDLQSLQLSLDIPAGGKKLSSEGEESSHRQLKIPRPCLYIFPEGNGQSSLFAMPDFALMVNCGGGSSKGAKFVDFASRMVHVDAALLTHWSLENVLGLRQVLNYEKAISSEANTGIRCILHAPTEARGKQQIASALSANNGTPEAEESGGNTLVELAKLAKDSMRASQSLHNFRQVMRQSKVTDVPKVVPLFHKVGQGSLEFYPLTPTEEDVKELSKFAEVWSKNLNSVSNLNVVMEGCQIPFLSHLSVSGILMWHSMNPVKQVLRILFTSPNAHQLRLLTALDALVASNVSLRSFVPGQKTPSHQGDTRKPSTLGLKPKVAEKMTAKKPMPTTTKAAKPMSKPTASRTDQKKPATPQPRPGSKLSSTPASTPKAMKIPSQKSSRDKGGDVHEASSLGGKTTPSASESILSASTDPVQKSIECTNSEQTNAEMSDEKEPVPMMQQDMVPQGLPPPQPVGNAARRKPTGQGAAVRQPGYSEASTQFSKLSFNRLRGTYVDVCFVPGNGDGQLVDAEWFKHVHATYYVSTEYAPRCELIESIIVGKELWRPEEQKQPTNIVLTRDNPKLLEYLHKNSDRLDRLKIDVLGIAERSTIVMNSDAFEASNDSNAEEFSCPGIRLDL